MPVFLGKTHLERLSCVEGSRRSLKREKDAHEHDYLKNAKLTFGDELYIAMLKPSGVTDASVNRKITVPVHVTRDNLTTAIEQLRQFCEFVESKRTWR